MTTIIAGHTFDGLGLDSNCLNMTKTDPPEPCKMTRSVLYTATEEDIDKSLNTNGYGAGFACHGRLIRTEYEQITIAKTFHEKRLEAMMNAMRELSSG